MCSHHRMYMEMDDTANGLDCPLVAGSRRAHKSSHVSGRDMDEATFSKYTSNQFLSLHKKAVPGSIPRFDLVTSSWTLHVVSSPPTVQRHVGDQRLIGDSRCECESEWLFVSVCVGPAADLQHASRQMSAGIGSGSPDDLQKTTITDNGWMECVCQGRPHYTVFPVSLVLVGFFDATKQVRCDNWQLRLTCDWMSRGLAGARYCGSTTQLHKHQMAAAVSWIFWFNFLLVSRWWKRVVSIFIIQFMVQSKPKSSLCHRNVFKPSGSRVVWTHFCDFTITDSSYWWRG